MLYVVKRQEETGVAPAYLSNLDTSFSTVRGQYWASFCSKESPDIFKTKERHIAEGLAQIIQGTVEELSD